jgi:precorrin-3B synthase
MSASLVRGACPGLSAPMQTGDGLLVRLTPKGPITIDAFLALCALARRHGNGVMEVTPRGNIQVRGLTAQSAPRFASAVADMQIASTCRVPLITDPVDDPGTLIDVSSLAAELSMAIADSPIVLAPKVSVAIDGGSRLHLDAVSADIRLRALASAYGPRLHVALGGDAHSATTLGMVAPNNAADLAVRLLEVIAARGAGARAKDILHDAGLAPFKFAVGDRLETAPNLPARPVAEPIGLHALRDGSLALGVALAFGQADAEALARLATVARDHGADALGPVTGRALLVLGLDERGAERVTSAAERLGFITRADDPRRRIAACAGKPACASGWLATRAIAAAVAGQLPGNGSGIALHLSGCTKGCAHPAPAALTIVGNARGAGIVRNGSASATPVQYVDAEDLAVEITRLAQVSEVDHV